MAQLQFYLTLILVAAFAYFDKNWKMSLVALLLYALHWAISEKYDNRPVLWGFIWAQLAMLAILLNSVWLFWFSAFTYGFWLWAASGKHYQEPPSTEETS